MPSINHTDSKHTFWLNLTQTVTISLPISDLLVLALKTLCVFCKAGSVYLSVIYNNVRFKGCTYKELPVPARRIFLFVSRSHLQGKGKEHKELETPSQAL